MDLFVVPTISLRLLYGLLILHHVRRQIPWLGATAHPTAEWISHQLTEAYGWTPSSDQHSGSANRAAIAVADGYCERAIGSIRRGCLNHVVVFSERHLRHLLRSYATYYNATRTHLSVNKNAPSPRTVHAVGRILPSPFLGGLHHLHVRV
jgi:Integrase core domain